MKRKLIIVLMAWLCFLIQTTVLGRLGILSVKPNILLILTVSIGFMQGRSEGLLVGFLCGIMIDLFYGDVFGFYALLYMLSGYFCGRF
ncbi:MAG: rod shape-determining protein MreD, partial [Lachnospiraceae bacterium]|nr:rod shape-determining protein MreD [Lachnospiraceae bacterium]